MTKTGIRLIDELAGVVPAGLPVVLLGASGSGRTVMALEAVSLIDLRIDLPPGFVRIELWCGVEVLRRALDSRPRASGYDLRT